MNNVFSDSQIKAAPSLWIGANCLLLLIECVIIFSQLHHLGVRLWSFQFFYLPVAVTVPYSVISPFYLKARSRRPSSTDPYAEDSVSYVASFSLVATYITLFICLAEFL